MTLSLEESQNNLSGQKKNDWNNISVVCVSQPTNKCEIMTLFPVFIFLRFFKDALEPRACPVSQPMA